MTRQVEDQPGRSPERIQIPAAMHGRILDHLKRALPNEGCGLLAGSIEDDGSFLSTRFFPGENTDGSPTRFTMDGKQVVDAFREMRETGLELGAIVHSHPASPAEPSPTDVRESHYPHALSIIVSFQSGAPVMRAWRWLDKGTERSYQECPVLVNRGV